MIQLKSPEEIEGIRKSCHLLSQLLDEVCAYVKAGLSTKDVDRFCYDFIVKNGGRPAFLHFEGFTGSACISINEEVIHGIPRRNRIIHDGDLVSVDLGINLGGFFSDSARTFEIGNVSSELKKLNRVTRECLDIGCQAANIKGARVSDIGKAVFRHASVENGYGVVRDYCGHGVGLQVHEEPEIPNYSCPYLPNPRLKPGMVIAIEPMINLGTDRIINLKDGWTVVTADGKPSAHWEHTVAITDNGAEILTL